MNTAGGKAKLEQLLKAASGEIERSAFESAREICDEAIAHAPDDLDALAMLGHVAMAQYRWQEAIGLFDRVLRNRVDPWTLANLGNCYWKTGDLDQAEYCLRGVLELEPGMVAARVSLATVLHARRRFDDALKELDIAARSAGADYQVESRRGCTLTRLEKYDEAQAAFQRAAERANKFVYPRLVAFDLATWDAVRSDSAPLPAPQQAFATTGAAGARGPVTLISGNPSYVRRFGLPLLQSYAARAQGDGVLHLHICDPDDAIVTEVRAVIDRWGVANFVATTESSPFPAERPQQRYAYHACARLLHMEYWLAHYARPVLSLAADFIVEDRLDEIVAAAAGADVALNSREPIDSPWHDVIANVVVANPTAAARDYFAAVRNYMLAMLEREPEAWLVEQAAMYCVLVMARRFATPPAVAWLQPDITRGRLWQIGHAYYDLLNNPGYRDDAAAGA